jgi:hypothetical protein
MDKDNPCDCEWNALIGTHFRYLSLLLLAASFKTGIWFPPEAGLRHHLQAGPGTRWPIDVMDEGSPSVSIELQDRETGAYMGSVYVFLVR